MSSARRGAPGAQILNKRGFLVPTGLREPGKDALAKRSRNNLRALYGVGIYPTTFRYFPENAAKMISVQGTVAHNTLQRTSFSRTGSKLHDRSDNIPRGDGETRMLRWEKVTVEGEVLP